MPTLPLPDGCLRYERGGSGPPVLLIQGAGVRGSGWQLQVGGLSGQFECVTFDNRGIGDSTAGSTPLTIDQMAADAIALMDAAGWESAHIVGHSMGGLIAQQLALGVPSRVRSLTLLCTFAEGAEAVRPTPRMIWLGIRSRVGTRAWRREAFLQMLFPDSFLKTQKVPELAASVGAIVGRDLADSPPIIMKQLRAMRNHNAFARLPELAQIPTLVVSATDDPVARPLYGRRLAANISQSRYVEIPDTSHGVIIQSPEIVNRLMAAHFETHAR